MKTMFNLTTAACDLDRFDDRAKLLSLLEGFDGIELMVLGEDERGLIPKERVIGLHMGSFPYWIDFWNGDEAAWLQEFGSAAACKRYFGGLTQQALIKRFRRDLQDAAAYQAEYAVLHVSDAAIAEAFTRRYRHSNREVVDATCALINELMMDADGTLWLLLENLWQPGLTMTDPEMTARLLAGIDYPRTGLMLDTGHLLHTNPKLRTQEEGLRYIHRMLDAHGELTDRIIGVHLHQSLSGAYAEAIMANPPVLAADYEARMSQMFSHAFAIDRHEPFTANGVGALIKRIQPRYLTFEFITENLAQHRQFLSLQRKALSGVCQQQQGNGREQDTSQ